jgi:CO/xanthine dehydrogenase FAD-binding subunit
VTFCMTSAGLLHLPTFKLLTPLTVKEAVEMMHTHPEAPIIAGGVYTIASMIEKKIRPHHLIDISKIRELKQLEIGPEIVRAGALASHTALMETFAVSPAFSAFSQRYTSPSIANIATVGGSMALKSSTEDLITILLVHDAFIRVRTTEGLSELPLDQYLNMDIRHALVEEVRFLNPTTVSAMFEKIALGISYIPLISAAARLDRDGRGGWICRIATSHQRGEIPGRIHEAETIIQQQGPGDEAINNAAKAVESTIDPVSDLMAPSWYRKRVAAVLVKRLLLKLRDGEWP